MAALAPCWLLTGGPSSWPCGPLARVPACFTIWHPGSPGGSDPGGIAGPGQSHTALYTRLSEATYHHFCHLLLVTQTSAGTTGEGARDGCEDQEVEVTRGRLGAWLLPPGSGFCRCFTEGAPRRLEGAGVPPDPSLCMSHGSLWPSVFLLEPGQAARRSG